MIPYQFENSRDWTQVDLVKVFEYFNHICQPVAGLLVHNSLFHQGHFHSLPQTRLLARNNPGKAQLYRKVEAIQFQFSGQVCFKLSTRNISGTPFKRRVLPLKLISFFSLSMVSLMVWMQKMIEFWIFSLRKLKQLNVFLIYLYHPCSRNNSADQILIDVILTEIRQAIYFNVYFTTNEGQVFYGAVHRPIAHQIGGLFHLKRSSELQDSLITFRSE